MLGRQKSSEPQNTAKKIAVGAAIAAAAGYVTGILTAPKSGAQTRTDLKNNATKRKTEAEKELKILHTELNELLSDAKEAGSKLTGKTSKDFSELTDKAKDAKEKARDLLSALHDGDADDKELKRAISEANKAIDHVKKFLKK